MHNISDVAQYGDTGADATLFDASLSPHGKEQVAALKGNAELATVELCVTSPLTRAVQTLCGAFPEAPKGGCPPVEFWPLAAEHLDRRRLRTPLLLQLRHEPLALGLDARGVGGGRGGDDGRDARHRGDVA